MSSKRNRAMPSRNLASKADSTGFAPATAGSTLLSAARPAFNSCCCTPTLPYRQLNSGTKILICSMEGLVAFTPAVVVAWRVLGVAVPSVLAQQLADLQQGQ